MARTMKLYSLLDPEVSSEPIALEVALASVGWKRGASLPIEFEENFYDVPIRTGVGHRVHNPRFPAESTQKYAFVGSPHEKRVPRIDKDGSLIVKYGAKWFDITAKVRKHRSGEESVVFEAKTKTGD